MRILILTPYLPHRRVGHGGGTSVRNLTAALARDHEVRVVSLLRPGEENAVGDVAALGADVMTVPFADSGARGWRRLALAGARMRAAGRSLRTRYPFYVAKYGAPALARRAVAAVADFAPDVVQVEYLQLALLLRALRRWRDRTAADGDGAERPRPRLVLNSHELGSLPRRRRQSSSRNPAQRAWLRAEAAAWERLQRDASTWADATLCVTSQDHDLYRQLGGRRLHTVPLGVDLAGIAADRAAEPPARALFVGSFGHRPNVVAARLLVETIWPTVRAALPAWELVLAGPGSDRFLAEQAPAAAGVRALGFVEDLAPVFRDSRLFVAPLTEGGGIKIKILETMARGLPVVTTPIGAEGIAEDRPDLIWLAADAASFPDAVLDAARQPEEAARRAAAARRHIEDHFSWRAIAGRLATLYTEI